MRREKCDRVFLGGSVESRYREPLIERLLQAGISEGRIINPILVEKWGEEARRRENEFKRDSRVACIFALSPWPGNKCFSSIYSLTEAVVGIATRPERTGVIFEYNEMHPHFAERLGYCYWELREEFPHANIFRSVDTASKWLIPLLK